MNFTRPEQCDDLVPTYLQIIFISSGAVGWMSNAFILVVQVAVVNARNPFIFCQAISDGIASTHFVMFSLPGMYPGCIELTTCLKRLSLCLYGDASSAMFTLLLGIDRLTAIRWPVLWNSTGLTSARYAAVVVAAVLYPGLMMGLAHLHVEKGQILRMCDPARAMGGAGRLAYMFWQNSLMVLNLSSLAVNLALLRAIKANSAKFGGGSSKESKQKNRELAKSTMTIALTHLLTYFSAITVVVVITSMVETGLKDLILVGLWIGAVASVNYATNGFIYCIRSKLYRDFLLKFLRRSKITAVETISTK